MDNLWLFVFFFDGKLDISYACMLSFSFYTYNCYVIDH